MTFANAVYAADTVNVQAGGTSFIDDVGDFVTKGVGSALYSGAVSIYNTGVGAINFFGGQLEERNVQKDLSDFDRNWGSYYEQNKDAIDLGGFVVGSFVPGGLAVKGLNMLRRGEAAGAFGRVLNYTTEAQTAALDRAIKSLASTEGTVFSRLNKDFLKSAGWGFADNAIQSLAFETAVIATMNQSPILEGQSWKDMLHDVTINAIAGGVIGGGIEAIFANGIYKKGSKLISNAGKEYELTLPKALERLAISDADKAFSYIDAINAIPKSVLEDDKVLDYVWKLNGKTVKSEIDVTKQVDTKIQSTVKSAYLKFEEHITKGLADGDTTVARPIAEMMVRIAKEGRDSNLGAEVINARLGDYLFGLEKVEGIGNLLTTFDSSIKWFNKNKKPANITDSFQNMLADADLGGMSRVRVAGNLQDLKVAMLGAAGQPVLAKEAWEQGYDVVFHNFGGWSLNPKSKVIRPAPESEFHQTFLNLKTGLADTKARATIADIATKDAPLEILGDKVTSGSRSFTFSISQPNLAGADTVELTARHLWASSLKRVEGTVDSADYSVLDRMSKDKLSVAPDTMIYVPGKGEVSWRDLGNFDEFVYRNKVEYVQDRYRSDLTRSVDLQELALEVNATPQWIENLIASKFNVGLKEMTDKAPDLVQGWQRDLAEYGRRENVLLNYRKHPGIVTDDYGNTVEAQRYIPIVDSAGNKVMATQGDSHITGMMAYQMRVQAAKELRKTAVASTMGADDFARLNTFDTEGLAKMADELGAGSGLVTSSNADYGDTLRLFAQDSGKTVNLISKKKSDAALLRIRPFVDEILQDSTKSAELVAIRTMVQRSNSKFKLMGTEYGLDGAYLVDTRMLQGKIDADLIARIREAGKSGSSQDIQAYLVNDNTVAEFLREHVRINGERVQKRQVLMNAQGKTSNIDPDVLYFPPIDTRKVPYFAFVRGKEGAIFGNSEVHMITASTPEQLRKLTGNVDQNSFDVIYKSDSEAFHKAKGDYDYNRAFNESGVNSKLKRDGALGDFMPSFKGQDVLEDFITFHQRQETQLVRDQVSTLHGQLFTELGRLSEQFVKAETSKAEPLGKFFARKVPDPYDDYMKTALDISKRSEFTILHQMNEFVDAVGTRAYNALPGILDSARKGDTTWEEATQAMNRYGLKGVFDDKHAYDLAQTAGDRNLIKMTLNKANMLLANFTLRFDWINSLVNTVSTPILLGTELSSIRNAFKRDPDILGKLTELTSLKVPGQDALIPSNTRLIFNAMADFHTKEGKALMQRFIANGDIKGPAALIHEFIDDMSPKLVTSDWAKSVDKWAGKATEGISKLTGNNLAEVYTRYVSAHVMHQLTDPIVQAGKMSAKEADAYISTFVNRVQGNYISSQRPILFQGTLGSAIGLFQTYQFNLLQQLFRHIENRDLKTVMTLGAMQGSIFGLNGLPMFDAINTHIIGSAHTNRGHKDVYTEVNRGLGKELGDWLMYGSASALPFMPDTMPSLYTRGDINPRHISIVPVSPLDVPAVDATIRFTSNLIDVGKKLASGGQVGPTLLEGLEHNSISRPLAGIAQVAQGFSTTSKGGLIAANLDRLSIASLSRVTGSKPMDESVALNQRFRQLGYQAMDRERIEGLGKVVKSRLRDGGMLTEDEYVDFAGKYAASGGNIRTFGSTLQHWSKDANTSVLNQLADHMKSPYGQRFNELMGGERLPDLPLSPAVAE